MTTTRQAMTEATGTTPIRDAGGERFDAWNPGIESELPWPLVPLSTIFRPENVFTGADRARELGGAVGLEPEALVVFRPERLVVHELLVRVTADFSVPDGPRVEDLGINFREMTRTLLVRHVAPRMGAIVEAYEALRRALAARIEAELDAAFGALAGAVPASPAAPGGFLARLRRARDSRPVDTADRRRGVEERIVREWAARAQARQEEPLARAACDALARVASALRARHGRLWGDRGLIAPVATGLACNEHGSEAIGALIDPLVREAAALEGYRALPAQQRPVVMNTKGAPASGKSTLRPLQRRLAARIGVEWGEFALISPDIWRKFLLDYGALGAHYKYAGTFTARELAIVDQKLDRYMARKAERGGMSHLLIDRFRFDSFAPDSDEAGSNLLTRFGHLVYLFFMITPPHETVERAWRRGLEVGRYKAVDDVLAQNIEAYRGMPELFFTWALRPGKQVHYEFLDNAVPLGERPRSVAFGWNGEMNVLDVKCLLDVERYCRINVNAAGAAAVYPGAEAMAARNNTGFLARCARELPALNFALRDSGRIYARIEGGRLAWTDPEALEAALRDEETRAGLLAVAPGALAGAPAHRAHEFVRAERYRTLGQWGTV
jgi:hypothetical protein